MVSRPDFPPPSRRRPEPFPAITVPGKPPGPPFQPARYVHGMLLGQGLAWLVLAAAGLAAWITSFPADLNLISAGGAVLWTGAELLGIVVAVCLGAAEVGMACRMRGGRPRALLAMSVGIQGLMLALALILAAFLITIGGSLLELLAVGALAASAARASASTWWISVLTGRKSTTLSRSRGCRAPVDTGACRRRKGTRPLHLIHGEARCQFCTAQADRPSTDTPASRDRPPRAASFPASNGLWRDGRYAGRQTAA